MSLEPFIQVRGPAAVCPIGAADDVHKAGPILVHDGLHRPPFPGPHKPPSHKAHSPPLNGAAHVPASPPTGQMSPLGRSKAVHAQIEAWAHLPTQNGQLRSPTLLESSIVIAGEGRRY